MSDETKPQVILQPVHLNRIISILIEQNDDFRKENEWLKIRIGLTEQGKSDDEIGEAFKAFWESNHKIGVGFEAGFKSISKIGVGFTEEWKSNDKTEMGLADELKSNPKTEAGLPEQGKPHPEIVLGQTELSKALPETIAVDGFITSALTETLRASGFTHVEKSTRRNAALLMLHFYNKGDGAYPLLRKVTGLSTGGVSKFVTAVRKRGLIKRYAYKKYELTAHGLNLLQQAYSKVKK